MASDQVQVRGTLARPPEAVWALLRDFCGAWHPLVASIRAERDARGALIRAFTTRGEDGLYREQLTWVSDSDRTLAYTHLEGIRDCQAYDAQVAVMPSGDGGTLVEWTATVQASRPRLKAICEGTQAVFRMGIAALETARIAAAATPPQPAPARLDTVTVPGAPRVALSITPDLGGRTLAIYLHGIGGARGNWRSQLAATGTLMRGAALDLRGYGESELGARQSDVDGYCGDILRVKAHFGAEKLVLVGLSYGSWIATSFAVRYPELLAGLVLSGGCTGMSEASQAEREAFRISRKVPLDAGQTPRDFAPAVVNVLAGPGAGDPVRAQLFDSMAAIPAATYRDALHCFTHPAERFDFARLAMPVLMMTGEHDRLAPPAEIRGVARRILDQAPRPFVRFEVIAGAGHVCNLEQPQAYNRHLLDFLEGLPQ